MSFFHKQLHSRRTKGPGRVGHTQKKILAMMEEESVIVDPKKSESVGLLDRKEQSQVVCVCVSQPYVCPCSCQGDALVLTMYVGVVRYYGVRIMVSFGGGGGSCGFPPSPPPWK